jgi:hypothetical protein
VRAFVEAWAELMPAVLAAAGEGRPMPHELIDFGPLALARAETRDDFRRALLAPSRYGRYLGPNRAP